jgi:hypothetical protein
MGQPRHLSKRRLPARSTAFDRQRRVERVLFLLLFRAAQMNNVVRDYT